MNKDAARGFYIGLATGLFCVLAAITLQALLRYPQVPSPTSNPEEGTQGDRGQGTHGWGD